MTEDPMADFIDRCCQRYQKDPHFRRRLEAERPNHRKTRAPYGATRRAA